MKIRIVVDANIIISALLGGKPRFILFDPKFEFITTSLWSEDKDFEKVRKEVKINLLKTEDFLI